MYYCEYCSDSDRCNTYVRGVGNIEFCKCGYVTGINEIQRSQVDDFNKLKDILEVYNGIELFKTIMNHNNNIYDSNNIKKRVDSFMFDKGEWITK